MALVVELFRLLTHSSPDPEFTVFRLLHGDARNVARVLDEAFNGGAKGGGIGMPRTGFDWHTRAKPIGSAELAAALAPLMQYCIEQFGPRRCMFESNFPVDKVSYSYNVLYNAFKRLSHAYSPAERAALFHDTAARVYRLAV